MPDYGRYAKIEHGRIIVRYSSKDRWGPYGWPPGLAREFGQYIIGLADGAERNDPKVTELTQFLEEVDFQDASYEEIALALVRAGYHK